MHTSIIYILYNLIVNQTHLIKQITNQTNSQLIILSFKQPFKQVYNQVIKPK